jgi:hypothetical protein
MPPSNRVSQLYTQAQGSTYITFYISQGYGGGALTCLQKGGVDD